MARKARKDMSVKKRHAEIVQVFARRLREVRRERGISQINLALRAGVHISYIGRLERAESAAGIDTVERLAAALGVPPGTLLTVKGTGQESLSTLHGQVRDNVEATIRKGDVASLHALAVVANALSQRR